MKSIKIVICGLSCSGKTTLIKELKNIYDINFIEGAKTLQEMAGISKKQFKMLDEKDKNIIRKKFLFHIQNIKSPNSIVVDGHYSFMKDDETFEIAMQEDFKIYDIVLFLDTDIKVLQQRLKQRDNKEISLENLQKWYDFELKGLQEKCKEYDTFFSVIDDDCHSLASFIKALENPNNRILPKNIFTSFIENHNKNLQKYKKIIVVDCDGTLAKNDITKEFYKIQCVEDYKIPNAFHNHRYYGFYQFFRLNQKRLEIKKFTFLKACLGAVKEAKLHNNLIEALCKQQATIIAITSGLRISWQTIFRKFNLPFLIVSPNRVDTISQESKAYFVKAFVNLGYEVSAIGDGKVDIQMLECANKPILIESKDSQTIYDLLSPSTQKKLKILDLHHISQQELEEVL